MPSAHSQEVQDSSASIEVWMTFYTIPQYLGLLRAKDVDFLQENNRVVVNDDLMEDLIRVNGIALNSKTSGSVDQSMPV